MFFVASKILDVLLSPVTWVLALVALSVVRRGKCAKWARPSAIAAMVVLYVSSLPATATVLFASLEHAAPRTIRENVTYDAVVVLGGLVEEGVSVHWHETDYNDNVERLLVAYDLLRKGRARNVLLSGGNASARDLPPEAELLAAQLRDWQIDPSRIHTEDRSRNTHENAVQSQKIVTANGWKDILLVTSAFHMQRALGCFWREGLRPDALPVDHRTAGVDVTLLPRATALAESSAAVHEWAGRVMYRLRGYSVGGP